MKRIPLTQEKFAVVDDEDFKWLNQVSWYARKLGNTFYALRNTSRKSGEPRTKILMHREILETPLGMVTDHADHNGLNNQRSNLRVCTNTENIRNSIKRGNFTSKFKGVYWDKINRKWRARLRLNKNLLCLGSFTNEIDAARCYDWHALKHFKEFANINDV